jgi:hypothetical protein
MTSTTAIALPNQIRKGLRFAWSERLQILIELPMFAVFIILLGPLIGQANKDYQRAGQLVSQQPDDLGDDRLVRAVHLVLHAGREDVLAIARRDPVGHHRTGVPVPTTTLAGRRRRSCRGCTA